MVFNVTIVGAGLAGSEAALVLARNEDVYVKLYEMRPNKQSNVHKTANFGELVCSNSLKSLKWNSAAGMLKYELASLASPLLETALNCRVDAGNALAVDRDKFAKSITKEIESKNNIEVCREEFIDINSEINKCDALILATGPLTSDALASQIIDITGSVELAFYDAAAPIVMTDSLDLSKIFFQDRYSNDSNGDYLNVALTKDEYENFINELINAECVVKKDFESKDLFQACQPIEELARSGFDSPRYGPMKPIGIIDPNTGNRPYAVVQLRAENKEKTSYNLVGFQTNLIFSEQKRIFRKLPGLENAEFSRFGVMHRNTFVNAPNLLDKNLCLKTNKKIYITGQLSGTEGYVEAIRSGHHAGLSVLQNIKKINSVKLSSNTAFGALLEYATNDETKNYQPMHVNLGIMPPLKNKIRNKQERYNKFAERAKLAVDDYVTDLLEKGLLSESCFKIAEDLKQKIECLWIKK